MECGRPVALVAVVKNKQLLNDVILSSSFPLERRAPPACYSISLEQMFLNSDTEIASPLVPKVFVAFFQCFTQYYCSQREWNRISTCSQHLRPDTCPLVQDERVNTVHQEPKFQPVLYIRDVIDGMIEYCGRYNVIVGEMSGFASRH